MHSCGPVGRRAHALVAVGGGCLLLHGGYDGSCELLQDTWLYDTKADVWMLVQLRGEGEVVVHTLNVCFARAYWWGPRLFELLLPDSGLVFMC